MILTDNEGVTSGLTISNRAATLWSIILSGVIVAFLVWLIYFKPGSEELSGSAMYLPPMIAACNALATVFIVMGVIHIHAGRVKAHAACMITALACSALFLILYITKYYLVGDTTFQGEALIRGVYLFILFSHIILSVIMLPMILMTVFFAATKRFSPHKALARWTFPIWLYVSVTGVIVYIFLNFLQTPA